ncbi:HpcH/HpaI aldolase/citrate lyase family protein [Saccharopolyspora phatthalungensis]|uniref:Citrate lyase subunit beta/citryl-CoA lyase n=1 Tax=Saccharopolyspora phatthalungensis TaxID=664693 RepID=A0A840QAC5_9PSEU|nr:CoA ester lyase [Saccharopolyspora phatthalungensis]MBB5157366.1 citrate lyase subunit beta/citryl-CoA lyase [Saccharopolyspora phatthalungensis]
MTCESARSWLFVPGHRPDRFDKALASEADKVIVDLEDAVAPRVKNRARAELAAWLAETGADVAVRINAPDTEWFDKDLALVRQHQCTVIVPKAEDPAVLEGLGLQSIPLIETACGVLRAQALARTCGVARLAFGSIDLATSLGVDPDDFEALRHARSTVVLASAAAGIAPPIDGVTTALHDNAQLTSDLARGRQLGFAAKLCVHPGQVTAVNEAFVPDADELAWAVEVLQRDDGGAVVVDGRMVDKPVVDRARRLVARAKTYSR